MSSVVIRMGPAVSCSFQENVTGIHATDFNPITNSFSIAVENITSYNGRSASCSASVGNSTVIESNRINIILVVIEQNNIEPGMSLITEFEFILLPHANLVLAHSLIELHSGP